MPSSFGLAATLIVGYLAVLFGLVEQHASLAGLSAFPVAIFEFSLGVWLIVKGFNPSAPIVSLPKSAAILAEPLAQ